MSCSHPHQRQEAPSKLWLKSSPSFSVFNDCGSWQPQRLKLKRFPSLGRGRCGVTGRWELGIPENRWFTKGFWKNWVIFFWEIRIFQKWRLIIDILNESDWVPQMGRFANVQEKATRVWPYPGPKKIWCRKSDHSWALGWSNHQGPVALMHVRHVHS